MGPICGSSTDFSIGSVVVPGVGEVMARCCLRSVLKRVDFPTFLLPKIPICGSKLFGMKFCVIIFRLFGRCYVDGDCWW